MLNRFWSRFIWNWDVMLHGSPAVDIFDGLKLAAGGELGIGVGEEDWGSGEREVLEGFVGRTEGLVDLVVSRFGELPPAALKGSVHSGRPSANVAKAISEGQDWLGANAAPGPSDGVIFSGVGAMTRASLRDVSNWMQWLYAYGEDAYGVQENPNSVHRRKRRKVQSSIVKDASVRRGRPTSTRAADDRQETPEQSKSTSTDLREGDRPPGIPPPIIPVVEQSVSKAPAPATTLPSHATNSRKSEGGPASESSNATLGTETLMKYLTLGVYGSSWGIPAGRPATRSHELDGRPKAKHEGNADDQRRLTTGHVEPKAESNRDERGGLLSKEGSTCCKFIIGLRGSLEDDVAVDDEMSVADSGTDREEASRDSNRRILVRTLHVELVKPDVQETDSDRNNDGNIIPNMCDTQALMIVHSANLGRSSSTGRERLRVVVYVASGFPTRTIQPTRL